MGETDEPDDLKPVKWETLLSEFAHVISPRDEPEAVLRWQASPESRLLYVCLIVGGESGLSVEWACDWIERYRGRERQGVESNHPERIRFVPSPIFVVGDAIPENDFRLLDVGAMVFDRREFETSNEPFRDFFEFMRSRAGNADYRPEPHPFWLHAKDGKPRKIEFPEGIGPSESASDERNRVRMDELFSQFRKSDPNVWESQ